MKYYRTIYCTTWDKPAFTQLSTDAQLVWLFIVTGPHTDRIPGLYSLGAGAMADRLADKGEPWEGSRIQAALEEMMSLGLIAVHRRPNVIYMPGLLNEYRPNNLNILIGWGKALQNIPDCPLKEEWLAELWRHCVERGDTENGNWRDYYHQAIGDEPACGEGASEPAA